MKRVSIVAPKRFEPFERLEWFKPSRLRDESDRPSMFGSIDTVSFGIFDPAFGHRAKNIRLCGGLGFLFNLFDALNLKTKMVDSPRQPVRIDWSKIDEAVGKIDRPILTPILFLQPENLFIVLRAFFPVLHVDGNMPNSWSFHNSPPCHSHNRTILRAASFDDPDFFQALDMSSKRVLVLSGV